jgi:hypothetical protein
MGLAQYDLLIAYTQEDLKSTSPHEKHQLLLGYARFAVTSIHTGGTPNTAHRLFNSSTRGESSLNTILSSLSHFAFCFLL